jgi:hypothetical protein
LPLRVTGTLFTTDGINVVGAANVSGPVNATDGQGDIAVLAGGGAGVRGQGSAFGVLGTGVGTSSVGVKGEGEVYGVHGSGQLGVFGIGQASGVEGDSSRFGVLGNGGHAGVKGVTASGRGVEAWSNSTGVQAWGALEGVKGVSYHVGIVGAILDPGVPVLEYNLPDVPYGFPDTSAGVVGNCVRTTVSGCIGIYGRGNAVSGFAHGIVGETFFNGSDSAGVIGIEYGGGQGVRGGSTTASGIGVVGYNTAGGKAGQFNGNVEIQQNLNVDGNAFKPGGGSWSVLSDVRTKKSILPLGDALSQLLKLRGVTYEYSNPSAIGELPGTHIGMVAQDVETVFPSWVDTGSDGLKRLTFRGFEAVAVEAVRQLDANAKETTARISELERENAELRRVIEALAERVKALQDR